MAAVDHEDLFIPLIDFAPFLNGSYTERKQTADRILHGFQKAGFIYLTNFGIPAETVEGAFAQSARFFARPQEEKDAMAWDCAESNRGYTGMGREKNTQEMDPAKVAELRESVPDLKESLEIGREGVAGHPNPGFLFSGDDAGEQGKSFKKETLAFFDMCKELHKKLMQAIALGLGIDETWFDDFTRVGDNTLRLLHYPATPKSVFAQNPSQVRCGSHSDYGSITILFQDSRGGLQVESPKGTFVDAKPIPGTVVINAGDLLARWSNDTIKSTIHRVVQPPVQGEGNIDPARYSIAYFCNPDFNRTIESIPGTLNPGEKALYEAVNSGEYITHRLATTY